MKQREVTCVDGPMDGTKVGVYLTGEGFITISCRPPGTERNVYVYEVHADGTATYVHLMRGWE